jgi:hypothetical protein
MHHSPERVNAPDLRRSCQDLRPQQAGSGSKVPVTCDVITRLHQARR